MSSVTEGNLGLNYGWAYGESGWNTGMDDNLVKLGFESRKRINGILSSPPSSPSNGDAYIVGTAPTGLFSGKFANIAIYDRGSWVFITPKSQEVVFNTSDGCDYIYNNGWSLKLEAEVSQYIKVKDFTFSTGYTITDQKQCLLNLGDNKYYQWFGALPKVVPAGSTPATAGGVGALLWVDRTDLLLRSDLASSATGKGYKLVYGAIGRQDLVLQSITKIPSYDNSNVVQAWRDSVSAYGYVYFSNHSKTQMVYTVPSTAGNAEFLVNSKVIIDKNVTLRFDSDLYSLFKSLQYEGEGTFEFTHLNFKTTGGETSYLAKQAILNRDPVRMKRVEWGDCKAYSIDGDTFTPVAIDSTSDSAAIFPTTASLTTGLFSPIAVGEHLSAHIRMEHQVATELGIMLRCSGGWLMFYGAPGASQWSVRQKAIGGAVVNGEPFSLPGNLLSYAPGKAAVGVALQSKNLAVITMNGVSTRLPYYTSDVGDVYEVGFVAFTNSASGSARVTGLCSYISGNGIHCKPALNVLIHGDSTSEDFISSFSYFIPQLMDGANGHRSYKIVNKAIAGQTMRQQLDLLKSQGPGDAYIVVMVAGTNDAQGGVSPDAFAAMVDEFVLYCAGLGRVPVWVEPYMWYSPSFIGGAGQTTSNYDRASELREAGKRQMMKYGNNAVCVTTTHQLPAPYPEYFGTKYDPILRDGIHQSQLGYRLYAEIICSAIIDLWSRVDFTPRAVPSWWAGANVTVQSPSSVSRNNLNVRLAATSFANGNTVLTLPRWCRPPVSKNIPVPFTADGESFGMAMATINASTGAVSIVGSTTTTPTFYVDISWDNA